MLPHRRLCCFDCARGIRTYLEFVRRFNGGTLAPRSMTAHGTATARATARATIADNSYPDKGQLSSDTMNEQPDDHLDHLSRLPSELLYLTFDYLFFRHDPHRIPLYESRKPRQPCSHDLDRLAATSRRLRAEINDWAIHILVQYGDITKYKQAKTTSNRQTTFKVLRGRNGLLSWAERHCIVCGKTTACYMTLMNSLKCCRSCDKVFWPEKITKTPALKHFYLKEFQLLPQCQDPELPEMAALRERFPDGIPRIRYGLQIIMSTKTWLFLRKDVEWLARMYHPNLEDYVHAQEAASRERIRKREEKAKEARSKEEHVVLLD